MNLSSLLFSRDCQSGRDWAEWGPSLHENIVVPTLTCLCRVTVLTFPCCQRTPPECELKVGVKTLEREDWVSHSCAFFKLTYLVKTNHYRSLSISCYCRRWAWGRMPEQGWDSRLGPWLHKCLTASQNPHFSPAPGQGDVYFPDTSMYVSNIPKRIRLHTKNNMPTKKIMTLYKFG